MRPTGWCHSTISTPPTSSTRSPRSSPIGPTTPGAHLAVITWDVSADGLVPVGRSHAELIAGGLAVLLESALAQDAVLLSTLTLSSFAGLATATLPWLLLGGTLALHQPFDPDTFLAQRRTLNCDTAIVPGPLAAQLAESRTPRGRRRPHQRHRRLARARAAQRGHCPGGNPGPG